MTTKNKVLAFALSLAMAFAVMVVPAGALVQTIKQAFAVAAVTSSNFSVKNIDEDFSVCGTEGNNQINFADYVTSTTNVEVCVYLPNGQVARSWSGFTASADNIYVFDTAGLHAVQFRFLSGGFYTYSKQYFVNVENDVEELKIEGMVPTEAEKGSVITIPYYDEFVAGGGSVRVFSPDGKSVNITLADGKETFTNIENVLGEYYIEYSKTATIKGEDKVVRVYKTVKFVEDFEVPTSLSIVLGSSEHDISADGETFFAFKEYQISDAVVRGGANDRVESEVMVGIKDVTTGKYYDFETKTFVLSEVEYQDVEDVDAFAINSVEGFTSATEGGHTYKFMWKAFTCYGTTLTKELTKKVVFNTKVASAAAVDPVDKYIQIEVVDSADEANASVLSAYEVPEIEIYASAGYSEEGYRSLITSTEIQIVDGTTTYSSLDTYVTDTVGLDANVYYFKSKLVKEKNVTLKYISKYSNGEGLEGDIVCSYTINFVGEAKDHVAPMDVVLSGYDAIISSATGTFDFVVPHASATDKDDKGNVTYGCSVQSIVVSPNVGAITYVEEGQTLTIDTTVDQVYTFTYTIVDGQGNSTSKTISVKVEANSASAAPVMDGFTADLADAEEGEKQIALTWAGTHATKAVGAIVFAEGSKAYSPAHTYENGVLTTLQFAHDGQNAVVTLYAENSWGCTYAGVCVSNTVNSVKPYEFAENDHEETIALSNGIATKVGVGAVGWWKENSSSFTIKAENGGLFLPKASNVFTFVLADTYTIETLTYDCSVEVKDETGIELDFVVPSKLVAEKGEDVEIAYPYVKNVFGYSITPTLKNSSGHILDLGDGETFEVLNKDVYSLVYDVKIPNGKTVTATISLSAGNISKPVITLAGVNMNVQLEHKEVVYEIQKATAVDKNGQELDVAVKIVDPYGKSLEIKDGKATLVVAGVYTITYTAVDADGIVATEEVTFVVENFVPEEDNSLSFWAILGIVLGSLAGLALIAFVTIVIIKKVKASKKRGSTRQAQRKKAQKAEKRIYTIAQSKDEKTWLVKFNNRMIAKEKSKDKAIEAAKSHDKKGDGMIRVYNKSGRLIDTI